MAAGIGELAALSTAVAWGASNQVQSAVGSKIGATGVALLRMPYQVFFLALLTVVIAPGLDLSVQGFIMLCLSGIAGIFISDLCLYKAITIIGPTTSVLILSTSTIFAMLLGWLFLQESLPVQAVAGIFVTMAGVLWVMTEHSASTLLPGQSIPTGRTRVFGFALAGIAAVSMGASFIFLKKAQQTGIDPAWAAFIRVVCGAVALWLVGAAGGWVRGVVDGLRHHPRIVWMLLFSCAAGATGIWLSSYAVAHAPVGVAATLVGLQPVMVTIIGSIWYRRRPGMRVVSGILVAFAGTALVCLR